jgi:hypothetical protein
MKSRSRFTYLTLVLFVAAASSTAQEVDKRRSTSGSLELGAWNSSLSGSPDVVSKYEPADITRPASDLKLFTFGKSGSLQVESKFLDKDNQQHLLTIDAARAFRWVTSYQRFLNRLGHDPGENLVAASKNARIVQTTDLDPAAEYDFSHGVFVTRAELQPKGLSRITLGVGYRDERRKGAHQSQIISHCDTCHVYSKTHELDQKDAELTADAKLAWSKGSLTAAYSSTQLRHEVPSVTLLYDKGLQPELRTPIFDNRLVFDRLEGPQIADHLQDVDKNKAKGDLSLHDVGSFDVNLGGVWSRTKNKFTSIEADYAGGSVLVTRRFKKKVTLRLRGRAYSTSSDDYFYDIPERVGTAGPQAGRSYRQIYGFDPDHNRRSALDRDVVESNAELALKLGKKGGTLRALWNFRDIDREYAEVAPGEYNTTTNVLGIAWRSNHSRVVKLWADYRHGSADNPYMVVNGACSENLPLINVTSPLAPTSVQYFRVHELRVAETTASPASWDEISVNATYQKPKAVFNASWRYWDGDNQAGDQTDWSRTTNGVTATLYTMPSPKWDWFVGYTYQKGEQGSHVCIPVFDG